MFKTRPKRRPTMPQGLEAGDTRMASLREPRSAQSMTAIDTIRLRRPRAWASGY